MAALNNDAKSSSVTEVCLDQERVCTKFDPSFFLAAADPRPEGWTTKKYSFVGT
jgi:hypothetical protein